MQTKKFFNHLGSCDSHLVPQHGQFFPFPLLLSPIREANTEGLVNSIEQGIQEEAGSDSPLRGAGREMSLERRVGVHQVEHGGTGPAGRWGMGAKAGRLTGK